MMKKSRECDNAIYFCRAKVVGTDKAVLVIKLKRILGSDISLSTVSFWGS